MNDLIHIKLIDNIRQTLKYKEYPSVICSRARVTCEAILSSIWQKEFNSYPSGIMFQGLADGIIKKNPILIPIGIQKLLGTIQIYGNYSSHAQSNLEELDESHAIIVEKALTKVAYWFFVEYLKFNPAPDFQETQQSENAKATNYRQILSSILEDGILELDEYYKLIEVRKSLQLDKSEYILIEKSLIQEKLGKSVENIREILKPGDLNSYKRKYENKANDVPEWVTNSLTDLENNGDILPDYKKLLLHFLKPEQQNLTLTDNKIIPLLGCWQGWYSQWNMKTFFNLFFIANSDSTFLGITYEPINPRWRKVIESNDGITKATIHGHITEDEIVSFTKKYFFKDTYEIIYNGVLVDDEQYYEGEWEIGKGEDSLSGSFNATKTKSLLPVHIFDTKENKPVTKIRHINPQRDLTGTWFIRLAGKASSYVILHLLIHEDQVESNIIYSENNQIKYQYINGTYNGIERIVLQSINHNDEDQFKNLRFTINWTTNEINGSSKEIKYSFRALKGYKI
jgi:hypothetical protein